MDGRNTLKFRIRDASGQTQTVKVVRAVTVPAPASASPSAEDGTRRPKPDPDAPAPRGDRRPGAYFSSNSILGFGGRKREAENELPLRPENPSKRRRTVERVGKGLRHFSMKVCEKVRKKGFTSYNEVADELVAEFAEALNSGPDGPQYDQKNIRRRVYDALNVLMAMNIISKEKKEIRWLGLPTNSVQECSDLEAERRKRTERIQYKTRQLHDLILKQISFKCLVERNREAEARGMVPSPTSVVQLPFIVVNAHNRTVVNCSVSDDKTEYLFHFDEKFKIRDDIDVLKEMGLLLGFDRGECAEADVARAKGMVAKSLESYVEQMARGDVVKPEELPDVKTEIPDPDDGEGEGDVDEEPEEDEEFSVTYSDDGEDRDSGSDVDVN